MSRFFYGLYTLLANVKFRNMKTRKEKTIEHLKYCQEKLKTVPERYHAYWNRQIKRCKKFLYGS